MGAFTKTAWLRGETRSNVMAHRVWATQLKPRSTLCDYTGCHLGGAQSRAMTVVPCACTSSSHPTLRVDLSASVRGELRSTSFASVRGEVRSHSRSWERSQKRSFSG